MHSVHRQDGAVSVGAEKGGIKMSIRQTIAERIATGRRVATATCYPNVLTYRDMTVEELRREEFEEELRRELVSDDREAAGECDD